MTVKEKTTDTEGLERTTGELRPERVAIGLRLEEGEVNDRAKHLPAWRLTEDRSLLRTWSFPDVASAAAFAQFVVTLGDASGHPPVVRQYHGRVTVRLATPQAGGLTEADFDLAHHLGAAA